MALRRWLHLAGLCLGLVAAYFTVPASPHLPTSAYRLRGVVVLLTLGLLAALVTRQLRLQLDEGADRRVDGLVVAVLTVVVTFAMPFYLLAQRDPHQVEGLRTRVDALHFTMATLTTLGYGDVRGRTDGSSTGPGPDGLPPALRDLGRGSALEPDAPGGCASCRRRPPPSPARPTRARRTTRHHGERWAVTQTRLVGHAGPTTRRPRKVR